MRGMSCVVLCALFGCNDGNEFERLQEQIDQVSSDNEALRTELQTLQAEHNLLQDQVHGVLSDSGTVDLVERLAASGLARTEDLPDTTDFLTLAELQTQLEGQAWLTAADLPDTSIYATNASLAAYVRTEELPTWMAEHDYATARATVEQVVASPDLSTWLTSHDLATRAELPDVSGLAQQSSLASYLPRTELVGTLEDEGYATQVVLESWVAEQEYALAEEVLPEADLETALDMLGVAWLDDLPDPTTLVTQVQYITDHTTLQQQIVEVNTEVQTLIEEGPAGLELARFPVVLSIPDDHATLDEALEALDDIRLAQGITATLWLEPGEHTIDRLAITHPDADRIHIKGRETVTVTCTTSCLELAGHPLGLIEDVRFVAAQSFYTAIQLTRGASLELRSVDIEGFQTAVSTKASLLTGSNVFIRDGSQALHASESSIVKIILDSTGGSVLSTSGSMVDISRSSLTGAPVLAETGSLLIARDVVINGAPQHAAFVTEGSILDLDDASLSTSSTGIVVEHGGQAFARRAHFDDNGTDLRVARDGYASIDSATFATGGRVTSTSHGLIELTSVPELSWLFVDDTSDTLFYDH